MVAVTVIFLLMAAGPGTSGAATPGVPYADPNVSGYIGLCNQAGQQITSGSTTATPFVWRAVSSKPAPAGYNGAGRSATLMAYLPMKVLPPGDWSSEQLTATSRYSNPDSPMAAATANDESLQTFVNDFPPELDGFVQLRLYLSAPDQEALVTQYPALDIQVTGTTWQAIGGGSVNCNSGTVTSIESLVQPGTSSTTAPYRGTATGRSAGAGSNSTGGSGGSGRGKGFPGGAGGSAGKGTASGVHAGSPGVAVPASETTNHVPLVAAIVIAALAVLMTLLFLFIRRRRPSEPTPPTPTTSS